MDPVLQWQKTLSDVDERSDPYQQRSSFLQRRVSRLARCGENATKGNSWLQDPRHKHEYLNKGVIYKLQTQHFVRLDYFNLYQSIKRSFVLRQQ